MTKETDTTLLPQSGLKDETDANKKITKVNTAVVLSPVKKTHMQTK